LKRGGVIPEAAPPLSATASPGEPIRSASVLDRGPSLRFGRHEGA
jgi:hypothetical protein